MSNINLKKIEGGVCAAKGFVASGVHCGIRKNKTKRDLALIYTEKKAAVACVYTQNLVKGAPLEVTKKHLENNFQSAFLYLIFSLFHHQRKDSIQIIRIKIIYLD